MNFKPILIHTHFHRKRTGITRSIENILLFFDTEFDTYIYGYGVEGRKISFLKLASFLFSDTEIVVHCHRNNEIMRMLLFRFFGASFKLISTRHSDTKPSGITKYLLEKSDRVITLTKNMSDSLGLENVSIAHGVDTEKFVPKTAKKMTSISQDNIILCAGRVRKAKGQDVLLNAAIPVLKGNKNWALVIVGQIDKSDFGKKLKSVVKNSKVQNQVYFIDETLDIISYYQASRIVVVPSFTEGFSLVCVEAMSCACTVIATKKVGIHSDLISNNKTGYLFEAGNVEELKEILLNRINDKLPHLGKEARKEVVKNWSAKKEAEGLVHVYKS